LKRVKKLMLGLVFITVLGEVGLRAWHWHLGNTGSLYDAIEQGPRRFKMHPSSAILVPERYGDIRYRFNREGYRDIDHDDRDGRRRMVWLGDSVSFGLGVDQDRTFVARLQKALAPSWDVIDLAIFAYHTGNELDALREDGLKHHPALVVVQFYMNDFSIRAPAGAGQAPPPALGLGDRLVALKNRLAYKSALYLRLQQVALRTTYALFHDLRRSRFPETLNDGEPRSQVRYLSETPDDSRIAAFNALREIQRLARGAGARLFVVLSPDEMQLFTARFDLVDERVRRFCAAQGIDFYDPLPQLRATPGRTKLYHDGVHYSPSGHALLARLILEEMTRRGLLSEPGQPAPGLGAGQVQGAAPAGRQGANRGGQQALGPGGQGSIPGEERTYRADEMEGDHAFTHRLAIRGEGDLEGIQEAAAALPAQEGPGRLLDPDGREAEFRPRQVPFEEVRIVGRRAVHHDAAVDLPREPQPPVSQEMPGAHRVGVLPIAHEHGAHGSVEPEEAAERAQEEDVRVAVGQLLAGEEHGVDQLQGQGVIPPVRPQGRAAGEQAGGAVVRLLARDQGCGTQLGVQPITVLLGEGAIVVQPQGQGLHRMAHQASQADEGGLELAVAEQARHPAALDRYGHGEDSSRPEAP
jgi:lysophospholipase L1-like esterase